MRPVFIGGCDRSGTTMLGAMLGGHPRALAVPESHFRFEAFRLVDWNDITVSPRAMLELVRGRWRSKLWGPALHANDYPARAKERTSYAEVMHWLVERHARGKEHAPPAVWIDHTPANLRYAPSLARLFPEASFIHVVRDGRAVAASLMPRDWGPSTIAGAAEVWKTQLAYGMAAETGPQGAHVIRVRYEDAVSTPEDTLRRLCKHVGIDYYPQMANGGRFDVPSYSQANHARVGRPPDPSRATAWRNRLSHREIERFEHATCELLASLGYELEWTPGTTRPASTYERLRTSATELLRSRLINPLLRRRRLAQVRKP